MPILEKRKKIRDTQPNTEVAFFEKTRRKKREQRRETGGSREKDKFRKPYLHIERPRACTCRVSIKGKFLKKNSRRVGISVFGKRRGKVADLLARRVGKRGEPEKKNSSSMKGGRAMSRREKNLKGVAKARS